MGGTTPNPTYHALGDHTESVQLEYDKGRVSYEELLDLFFSSHNPTRRPWSRQYMSAIFYHSPEQQRHAEAARDEKERRAGAKVYTEILPAGAFHLAEDYHQKYILQGEREIFADFRAMYPDFLELINSTAATRVNGYLYGCGTLEELRQELGALGLSASSSSRLLERVRAAA